MNGVQSVFSFWPATKFVGRHIGSLLEQQKQDSHIYQKTGSLPLIFLEKIRVVTTKTTKPEVRNCEKGIEV